MRICFWKVTILGLFQIVSAPYQSTSEAAFLNGHQLQVMCREFDKYEMNGATPDPSQIFGCSRYVMGVFDSYKSDLICNPDSLSPSEASKIALNHLKTLAIIDKPQLNSNASELVVDALEGAFPCSDSVK